MRRSKSSLAFGLGVMAALGGFTPPPPPDRSHRESNRMPLTEEEMSRLETLSGKEKKQYVKQLRRKYNK